jgi:acetylornithine/succinyldiaminopimelate/putrescine aminotransferase
LLFSAEVDGKTFEVVGENGLEKYLRKKGMGVIHGGENSLRFTPHFRITSKEIDLVMDLLAESLENAPRLK